MSCTRQRKRALKHARTSRPSSSSRVAVAGLLSAAALGLGAAPAGATVVNAAPVSQFRDANGVQMHTNFAGLPGDQTSVSTLQSMLRTLGIWHVRDNVCLAKDSECVRPRLRLSQLADSLGAGQPKVDLLLHATNELQTHPDRIVRDADIERALIAMSTPPLAGHVGAIEQTNEPDLQKIKDWAPRAIADDASIRSMLTQPRFSSLTGLPLLGASMGHSDATPTLLAAGWPKDEDTTPNFHPYPPAWGGPENALSQPCTKVLTVMGCATALGPLKPWATESGYSTNGNILGTNWVSRQAQAVYLPRLLLDNFAKGVARTYLYELIDLNIDSGNVTSGYGLWRAKLKGGLNGLQIAGSAKPAALAISRLNERLGDAGAGGAAGSLDLTIADAAGNAVADTAVRRVLLRRADGSYALALWQPKAVWKNVAWQQKSIFVPEIPITVTVNGDATYNATALRPSLDQRGVVYANTKSLTIPVGADVTLIDLRAPGAGTIPGGPVILR